MGLSWCLLRWRCLDGQARHPHPNPSAVHVRQMDSTRGRAGLLGKVLLALGALLWMASVAAQESESRPVDEGGVNAAAGDGGAPAVSPSSPSVAEEGATVPAAQTSSGMAPGALESSEGMASVVPDVPSLEEGVTSSWSRWRVSGYLKNETAYRFHEPRSITKIRNIAYLNAQYPVAASVNFNFTGWAYYDLAYDLFNYETIAARLERNAADPLVFVENLQQKKDSPVAAVRELYFDISGDNWDARLGKQYVIWGVLEGVRIVDEINPMDFRELILPDLLDYRIPLWTAKLNYYADSVDYEFLVIPELQFHKPAPPGSEWELLQEVPGTRYPESWRLENTEVGLRAKTTLADTEFNFSYFYTWDDFPVIFRTVKLDGTVAAVTFPTFTRIHMYGVTAVKQHGPYILKGEFAYVTGKYFGLRNTADRDGDGYVDYNGEVQKDHIRWGAGIEFQWQGWDWAPGVTQWYIPDYDRDMIQARTDTAWNLFVRREFPQYSMTAQVLFIYLQTLDETYLKPKLFFQVTNRFQVAIGLDLFDGSSSNFGTSNFESSSGGNGVGQFNASIQQAQFLGNFHDNDRVFFEFKYSF